MASQCAECVRLAWRDWKFEYLLSLCAVLALASMLTPILVLQGLKNGVVESMRARLLQDPSILVITPKSDGGKFSPRFISELAMLPGAAFAIGRTRDTSTDITLARPDGGASASISLEPAEQGEPVLERYKLPAPQNTLQPEIVLSAPAAKSLSTKIGDILDASLARRTPRGKLESEKLVFRVTGILPLEAADRKMGFVSLRLLEDMENYRDYLEVPGRGLSGSPNPGKRDYASFRLYAKNLDAVEDLANFLENRKIEVLTRAREIAAIRMLEGAINQVILIISLAVGAGFVAFTLSSAQSAVSRKKRMLGMLRLLGFNRLPLMLYSAAQTVFTAICGFVLSLCLYEAVALGIGHAFSGQAQFGCRLGPCDIIFAVLVVFALSLLACLRGAWSAAAIEPSIVIREV